LTNTTSYDIIKTQRERNTTSKRKEVNIMYNNGNYYGNSSMGMSYSPDPRYDVDRFNESTRSNYSPTYASGSKQGGYYHSADSNRYYILDGRKVYF
jgi:hypothetical protein